MYFWHSFSSLETESIYLTIFVREKKNAYKLQVFLSYTELWLGPPYKCKIFIYLFGSLAFVVASICESVQLLHVDFFQ